MQHKHKNRALAACCVCVWETLDQRVKAAEWLKSVISVLMGDTSKSLSLQLYIYIYLSLSVSNSLSLSLSFLFSLSLSLSLCLCLCLFLFLILFLFLCLSLSLSLSLPPSFLLMQPTQSILCDQPDLRILD